MDMEGFLERYGQEPGKDDLTILAPKQDDPTEQVLCCCFPVLLASLSLDMSSDTKSTRRDLLVGRHAAMFPGVIRACEFARSGPANSC